MISFQPQHMVENKVSSEIGKVKQLSILAKVSSRDGCRDSILAKGTQNLMAPFAKKQKYFLGESLPWNLKSFVSSSYGAIVKTLKMWR